MAFVILFSAFSVADEWVQNSSINASLPAYDIFTTPSIFQLDGTFYMLSGSNNGNVSGFDWNGAAWESNSSINASFVRSDYYSIPTVFTNGGLLQMIVGYWLNVVVDLTGYTWNGTNWNVNASVISGTAVFSSEALYHAPTVFTLPDNNLYLIDAVNNRTFPTDYNLFAGFGWNGTNWILNSTVVAGLPVGITRADPDVFLFNSTTINLLYCASDGKFYGFTWNGSGWTQNATISASLGDIGTNAAPNFFELDGQQYLIAGSSSGTFFGYNWNVTILTPLPPSISMNTPANTSYVLSASPNLNYDVSSMVNSTFPCNATIDGLNIYNETVTNNTNYAIPLNLSEGFYYLNLSCSDDYGLSYSDVYFTVYTLPTLVEFFANNSNPTENTDICINATIASGTYGITGVDVYFIYPDSTDSGLSMQNSTSIDGCGGGGNVWSINVNVGAAFDYPNSFFTIYQFDITDSESNTVSNDSFTPPVIVVNPPTPASLYIPEYSISDSAPLLIDGLVTAGVASKEFAALFILALVGIYVYFKVRYPEKIE